MCRCCTARGDQSGKLNEENLSNHEQDVAQLHRFSFYSMFNCLLEKQNHYFFT